MMGYARLILLPLIFFPNLSFSWDCALEACADSAFLDDQAKREHALRLWFDNQPFDTTVMQTRDTLGVHAQFAKAVYTSNWNWLSNNLGPDWQAPMISFCNSPLNQELSDKFQILELDFPKYFDTTLIQSHKDLSALRNLRKSNNLDSLSMYRQLYLELLESHNPWTQHWIQNEDPHIVRAPVNHGMALGIEITASHSYPHAQPNLSGGGLFGLHLGWSRPWFNLLFEDHMGLGFLAKDFPQAAKPEKWQANDGALIIQAGAKLQLKPPISILLGIHPLLSFTFNSLTREFPFGTDVSDVNHLLWGYGGILYLTLGNTKDIAFRQRGNPASLVGLQILQKRSINFRTPMEWNVSLVLQLNAQN